MSNDVRWQFRGGESKFTERPIEIDNVLLILTCSWNKTSIYTPSVHKPDRVIHFIGIWTEESPLHNPDCSLLFFYIFIFYSFHSYSFDSFASFPRLIFYNTLILSKMKINKIKFYYVESFTERCRKYMVLQSDKYYKYIKCWYLKYTS